MPWMMATYVAAGISISVAVYRADGIGAAACALAASCLAVIAAGALKFGAFWASGAQRVLVLFVASVLLLAAYGLSRGFSLVLFGHALSGEVWAAIGAIVGFVAMDKRMAADLNKD